MKFVRKAYEKNYHVAIFPLYLRIYLHDLNTAQKTRHGYFIIYIEQLLTRDIDYFLHNTQFRK